MFIEGFFLCWCSGLFVCLLFYCFDDIFSDGSCELVFWDFIDGGVWRLDEDCYCDVWVVWLFDELCIGGFIFYCLGGVGFIVDGGFINVCFFVSVIVDYWGYYCF